MNTLQRDGSAPSALATEQVPANRATAEHRSHEALRGSPDDGRWMAAPQDPRYHGLLSGTSDPQSEAGAS